MGKQPATFSISDLPRELGITPQTIRFYKDKGLISPRRAGQARLFYALQPASETAGKVCSNAIQIHGGYGYVSDFPVERIYRDVHVCQIYEGANDIKHMVIARAIEAD